MCAARFVRPAVFVAILLSIVCYLALGNTPVAAQPGRLGVSAGGPYTGPVGSPVVFMARVDFGGRPPTTAITFEWDFGDGTSEMNSGQTTSHVYSQPGSYTLTVTLFLLAGRETATDSTTVEITGGQLPGQLTISAGGPYSGQVGSPVFFMARFDLGGRPPDTAISFEWRFGDGTVDMNSGQTTTHVYASPGTYTVTVTLFVLAGRQTAMDSTIAQISPAAPTVTASAGGPYSGTVGQPVAMTGTLSQAGVPVSEWSWSFGDGTTGSGQTVQATYRQPGTFTVTLTVRLGNGGLVMATTTATVSAAPPQSESVQLFPGCNNVALTWAVGTPMTTVAAAISPPGALMSIFRFDSAQQRFNGFSPTAPAFANDYTMVVAPLEAVFVCMSGAAIMQRPDPSAPSTPTPSLVGPVYRWQETLLNDGQRFVPPNPASYTLQLFPDGTAAAQADCNRASGSYTLSGNQLTLSFQAVTLVACPPGSLGDRFLTQLNGVSSFFFRDTQLFLELMFDSGTMRFNP